MALADEKTTPVGINLSDTINETPDTPAAAAKKPRFGWVLLFQVLSLIWIAPIVALLVLNFRGHIIGAGLRCGVSRCEVSLLNYDAARQRGSDDHNILGALQLVAKALEIWFGAIVGSMVYDLTMYLASTEHGLPIFYLGTHLDLSLKLLLQKPFWTSANPPSATDQGQRTGGPYFFIVAVAVALIVSNLMGPATALLLLPTLGWRTVPVTQSEAFSHVYSAYPPAEASYTSCSTPDFGAGNYSCNTDSAATLDLFFQLTSGSTLLVQRPYITYTFNDTGGAGLSIYSPIYQSLGKVAEDYDEWRYSLLGDYKYAVYASSRHLTLSNYNLMRNAQQTLRKRIAPAFSTQSACYQNGTSVVRVADDMSVHCYNIPNPDDVYTWENGLVPEGVVPQYPISNASAHHSTKCIRVGSRWPGTNNNSAFWIGNSSDLMRVNVYSSDRAIYLNETTYPCLTAANISGCDWNALFSEEPHSLLRNSTVNPQITEYSMSGFQPAYCLTSTFLRFPTYVLDTEQATNPYHVASLQDADGELPFITDPIIVHPDWTLFGWGVDRNGTVSPLRASSTVLVTLYRNLFPISFDGPAKFTNFHNLAAAQGEFYIGYGTINTTKVGYSPLDPVVNPALDSFISVYIWSYGLDSTTSKLGAALAIIACILVLLKVVFGLLARTADRSFVNLIIGALKQDPPEITRDISNRTEENIGKNRFSLKDRRWAEYRFGHLT